MKSSKPTVPPKPRPPQGPRPWLYLVAGCAILLAVLEAYQPALNGPFLFDDLYLPLDAPKDATLSLAAAPLTYPSAPRQVLSITVNDVLVLRAPADGGSEA